MLENAEDLAPHASHSEPDVGFARVAPAPLLNWMAAPQQTGAQPASVDISHIAAAGNYAAEKRPDVITIIGDWWDFPSLSSYDRGKLCFEGRRYRSDVEAGKAAMEKFLAPIRKAKGYRPRVIFTMGNHEHRVQRVVDEDSRLQGAIGV